MFAFHISSFFSYLCKLKILPYNSTTSFPLYIGKEWTICWQIVSSCFQSPTPISTSHKVNKLFSFLKYLTNYATKEELFPLEGPRLITKLVVLPAKALSLDRWHESLKHFKVEYYCFSVLVADTWHGHLLIATEANWRNYRDEPRSEKLSANYGIY